MSLSITFDDGLIGGYEAHKIMKRHGMVGTAYVITGLLGSSFKGRRCMTLEQLHEMRDAGWEIGSHTITHRTSLSRMAPDECAREIVGSKEWLEEKGFQVWGLAYPWGAYNQRVLTLARRHYEYARGPNRNRLVNLAQDRYAIPTSHKIEHSDFVNVKEVGGWEVVLFHGMSRDFPKVLDNASRAGLEVIPVIEGVRRYC